MTDTKANAAFHPYATREEALEAQDIEGGLRYIRRVKGLLPSPRAMKALDAEERRLQARLDELRRATP